MFDLNPDQVKEHLAKYAVLKCVDRPGELELDVQAVFDTHFHLDGLVGLRGFSHWVENYEFFLFGDLVVTAIDHYVDVVTKTHNNSIVGLELLFHPIERETILS